MLFRLRPPRTSFLAALAFGAMALGACREPEGEAPTAGATAVAAPAPTSGPRRIVALGGSVTETLYALGAGGAVAGVDASSVWPPEANAKPNVGYFRAVPAEGVLALGPDLVLADRAAGPPTALAQLRAAGVPVTTLPGGPSVDSVAAHVAAVARAVGREAAGRVLVDSLRAQIARADRMLASAPRRPRVVFVQGQGGGALGLAGSNTNADALIRLAGGENALAAAEGYRPMTPEAVAEAAPDVILMTERTAGASGGADALLARPGVAQTPAASARRVVVIPDAAMNFGPGLGEAVLDLARKLHPELNR